MTIKKQNQNVILRCGGSIIAGGGTGWWAIVFTRVAAIPCIAAVYSMRAAANQRRLSPGTRVRLPQILVPGFSRWVRMTAQLTGAISAFLCRPRRNWRWCHRNRAEIVTPTVGGSFHCLPVTHDFQLRCVRRVQKVVENPAFDLAAALNATWRACHHGGNRGSSALIGMKLQPHMFDAGTVINHRCRPIRPAPAFAGESNILAASPPDHVAFRRKALPDGRGATPAEEPTQCYQRGGRGVPSPHGERGTE